ncbi:MAG TPA: hypothetical protein PLY34_20345 [Ferruginibacter sp.]|nr:hypothetical protein [Ferruginibacter sp.]
MKKILYGLLIPCIFGAVSCKKESNPPPTPAAEKFMTLTAGSTWTYRLTDNPATAPVSTNYTLTATSNDSAASGRTYKIFTNNSGPNEYYNITASDYYTFRKLPDVLGGTSVEVLYLKDNLNVGGTWSQTIPITYSGISLQLTFNNKIAEKGIAKIVNGINYTGVTKVETTLSVTGIPFAYTLDSDIEYYYAPKVGQIENHTAIDLTVTGFPPTNVEQKTELRSSTIL